MTKPTGRKGAYETLDRRVGIRITTDVHKRLQRMARARHVYMADLVRGWIEDGLNRGEFTHTSNRTFGPAKVTFIVRLAPDLKARLDHAADAHLATGSELAWSWLLDGLIHMEHQHRKGT